MKQTFTLFSLLLAAVILMTACTRNPSGEQAVKGVAYEDTVGFSQFQQWKAQHERIDPATAYQPVAAAPKVVYVSTPQKTARRASAPVATAH